MRADPAQLLFLPVCVLSVVVHECAHGSIAWWRGDSTARDQGRLTLNPIPHLSMVGSILVPSILLIFHSPLLYAWAKPAPVDRAKLHIVALHHFRLLGFALVVLLLLSPLTSSLLAAPLHLAVRGCLRLFGAPYVGVAS